ncbi:hypothetical protein CAOG_009902 [Capsaspora owczarzaki ATCC 30864]|uniref:Uncharacterized protein n=1 Tax=Capsaspora owczarzaki (strain ATCC 30864) TaxID=595528 RepID=A0A0D2WU06_CAPO3|nr:hypothetical protein CAOG_009902 [Capsaspora owczarzaki ATCC 30864]
MLTDHLRIPSRPSQADGLSGRDHTHPGGPSLTGAYVIELDLPISGKKRDRIAQGWPQGPMEAQPSQTAIRRHFG